MDLSIAGAIDCDVHPALPGVKALLPHLDDYWQEQIETRGIDGLELASYPPHNPLVGRADWRDPGAKPGTSLERLRRDALDRFGTELAICNVLYGGSVALNVDFGAALCRATNAWLATEWLDREPRLRGSIVVPMTDPDLAIAEIERCADDPRFVQVMLLAMGETPLGRRAHWPVYRAAAARGLPICIHAGSAQRFAPSYTGWPSYFIEDYAAHAQGFQGQLLSMVYEGVFNAVPDLRVVLAESGVSWLPSFLWRASSTWKALRWEVPWLERSPAEIVRDHVRLTIQPFDAPPDPAQLEALLEQIGSDEMLLFSTDYPHWQFDSDAALPAGFPTGLVHKIAIDNPRATYPRLDPAYAGPPNPTLADRNPARTTEAMP